MTDLRKFLPLSAVVAVAAMSGDAQAQQSVTVTGTVTGSATGQPLAAVQVAIPSLGVGAQTREDGRFTFAVPARAVGTSVTVTARRIGYRSVNQTVALRAGSVNANFALEATATQLTGVVVSALSVQRERATIGTSQQEVSGAELTKTRDPNIVNALSGKVAGVQISQGGNIGGSSRIVIRGANSINGNNQPLFIVDGIPVSNSNVTTAGQAASSGGIDYGNAIRDLNPDDIASITVLKGPNAAALYGSRAANGAVVITTKGGRAGPQTSLVVNSYTTFETPQRLPSYQNQYGQGLAGQFSYVNGAGGGTNDGVDESWGPRFEGQPIDQFTGKGQPWIARPNNVADFFQTGRSFQNNVALSANVDRAAARLSFGNDQVSGIIPNSRLAKTTVALNGDVRVSDRLSTSANAQFIRNEGRNRPGTGYSGGVLSQFVWFGRQVDVNALRGRRVMEDGSLYNWNSNYHNNPFWLQQDNPNQDQRDRFIGVAEARYTATPWLTGTLRSGIDNFRENRDQNYAAGNIQGLINLNPNYAGGFDQINRRESEFNTEGFLTARGSLLRRLDVTAIVGGNLRRNTVASDRTLVTGLSVAEIYNVSNAAVTPTAFQDQQRKGINSVYGSASATFNRFWTVDVTGRNDWSSTLPAAVNSYFYPSVSTSLVLSDALPALQSRVLSFAKLRGSWAQVGNDTDPYALRTVYIGQANKFGPLPQYTLSNTLANANLRPERVTSAEGGLELGMFENRLTLDATYYARAARDQIINLPVSQTTGFNAVGINAGRVDNKGVEVLLTAVPVRLQSGFTWTSTVNWARNRNKIVTLTPQLSTVPLGTTWGVEVQARQGEQYGALVGAPYLRDKATGQLLLSKGLPLPDNANRRVLGNYNPDWVGGWNNEFRFKRLSASALLDARRGGNIYSVTHMFGTYAGVLDQTLRGREAAWNNPGVVVQGIDRATGQPNTLSVGAQQYWQSLYGIHEAHVFDASFVKLRELRVGYDLPQRLLGRVAFRSANVALVGRNLFLNTNVPHVDPEAAYSAGNVQGLEFAAIPTSRSFGINFTITP